MAAEAGRHGHDLALSTRERAFVVAAVRVLGPRSEAVCARRSAAMRRQAALLLAEPARLAAEAERLSRAVPDGIGAVHPSWYEAPPPSERPEAAAWLARRAYGHLVEMTPRERVGGGALEALERAGEHTLERVLLALGRRRVATAFSGAPRASLAQLCARLGEPAATELIAEVQAVASTVSSDEVRTAQRALFQIMTGAPVEGETARGLFLRAGAAWLGPALAMRGGDRPRRVAQRMARPVGELLLAGAAEPATEADALEAARVVGVVLTGPRGL